MWMKIDDGLHAHRKTRAVTKSHHRKVRDAAPMGLWVLAGSWAAQNRTDGWVPEDELDRFDEDWRAMVARLVAAGYWWPAERDGEAGYGFNDWLDYNPESDTASRSGSFGNHVRWHEHKGIVNPECEHCPKEPISAESLPEDPADSGGDIGGRSGGESGWESRSIALPLPDPTRTRPEPEGTTSSDKSDHTPERFDEFWDTYDHKVGRKKCVTAYRVALKKPGVTDDVLITAAAAYITWCRQTGTYIKNPLTWLHGEHWTDERVGRPEPPSRVQQHLALARQLAEEESGQMIPFPQIGGGQR